MNRLVLGCVHSLIYLVLAIKHCKLYHPCMHALHILVLVLTMQTQIAYCKIWFMYGHYTLYDERWGNPIGLVCLGMIIILLYDERWGNPIGLICLGMIIYFCMHDERRGNPTSSKIPTQPYQSTRGEDLCAPRPEYYLYSNYVCYKTGKKKKTLGNPRHYK